MGSEMCIRDSAWRAGVVEMPRTYSVQTTTTFITAAILTHRSHSLQYWSVYSFSSTGLTQRGANVDGQEDEDGRRRDCATDGEDTAEVGQTLPHDCFLHTQSPNRAHLKDPQRQLGAGRHRTGTREQGPRGRVGVSVMAMKERGRVSYGMLLQPIHTLWPSSHTNTCLLYTSPSPRDGLLSRMPSSA